MSYKIFVMLGGYAILSTALSLPERQNKTISYSLPGADPNPAARAAAIKDKRKNFVYGGSDAGGPFYPAGSLGNLTDAGDFASLQVDFLAIGENSLNDASIATSLESIKQVSFVLAALCLIQYLGFSCL
jgi:hypothetical protein